MQGYQNVQGTSWGLRGCPLLGGNKGTKTYKGQVGVLEVVLFLEVTKCARVTKRTRDELGS